jgi:transcriptional antiterminator NusG
MPAGMAEIGLRWFAFRTRPRAEKRVHKLLRSTGFESYLPLIERISQWSDRKKRVEYPLFPGYVFCQVERERIGDVVRTTGIVDVVRVGDQAAPVRDDELDSVRALMEGANRTGTEVHPAHFLKPGENVLVASGPFEGLRGTLTEERGSLQVVVNIRTLQQAVGVQMDRRHLVSVNEAL